MSERSWWKNIAWWQTTVDSLSWLTKLKAWSVMKTICHENNTLLVTVPRRATCTPRSLSVCALF